MRLQAAVSYFRRGPSRGAACEHWRPCLHAAPKWPRTSQWTWPIPCALPPPSQRQRRAQGTRLEL
eukprot:scaffold70572_cov48-Phaeocystis_antarctica.AAC.2